MAFKIYDSTLYSGKPASTGMSRITVNGRLWRAGESNESMPSLDYVKELIVSHLMEKPGAPYIFDIEHWNPYYYEQKRKYLIDIFSAARTVSPSFDIGMYAFLPKRDYWRANSSPSSDGYKAWETENDTLKPIADSVSFLCPSLYTFYDDLPGWKLYARRNIEEAWRYQGKRKIVPFLWPEFHDSNQTLKSTFIQAEHWYEQLTTLYKYADSAIIWGGWNTTTNTRRTWDENAPWWIATKIFMRENGVSF